MSSPYYPDDIQGWQVCIIEGCAGPNCPNCGRVNYHWLGYLGYIGRMAKKWGITKVEAEKRIEAALEARALALEEGEPPTPPLGARRA